MPAEAHSGGCLCGAVRFVAEGPAKWVAYCHCASCRRATGAPVTAYAGFAAAQVTIAGETFATFASSPGARRGFCHRCGTPLTYQGDRWPGELHLHLGAFDRPQDLPPTGEAFRDERLPWLHLEVRGGS
jgi:hypothetical protein